MCKAWAQTPGGVFQMPAYRTPCLEGGPACLPLFRVKQTVFSPGCFGSLGQATLWRTSGCLLSGVCHTGDAFLSPEPCISSALQGSVSPWMEWVMSSSFPRGNETVLADGVWGHVSGTMKIQGLHPFPRDLCLR